MASNSLPTVSIHLIHNSMRLHDNPPLHTVSTLPSSPSKPAYFIPLHIVCTENPFDQSREPLRVNRSRAKFVVESLECFNDGLGGVMGKNNGERGGIVCLQTKDWLGVKEEGGDDDEEEEEEEEGVDYPYTEDDIAYAGALKSFLKVRAGAKRQHIAHQKYSARLYAPHPRTYCLPT